VSVSEDREPTGAGPSDDLGGLEILLVEDSPDVADALKSLLELLGANVTGPATTIAEAERLIGARLPDAALVDFHLRAGEHSSELIATLRQRGVHVIALSGSFESPPPASMAGAVMLEKPVSEAQLLARLAPIARKATQKATQKARR
jgi:DNA-binding response OmpR family regulator